VSLFERGEFDWSERIEDAIAGGSTGTEILMRIRFCLRQLLESDALTQEVAPTVRQLVAQLDEVLR
jgi:hypothetical protein